jgi:hypothetical protein
MLYDVLTFNDRTKIAPATVEVDAESAQILFYANDSEYSGTLSQLDSTKVAYEVLTSISIMTGQPIIVDGRTTTLREQPADPNRPSDPRNWTFLPNGRIGVL